MKVTNHSGPLSFTEELGFCFLSDHFCDKASVEFTLTDFIGDTHMSRDFGQGPETIECEREEE